MNNNRMDASKLDLQDTIVSIRRVAGATVKGGRNMRFSVTVVVGDHKGHVGGALYALVKFLRQ